MGGPCFSLKITNVESVQLFIYVFTMTFSSWYLRDTISLLQYLQVLNPIVPSMSAFFTYGYDPFDIHYFYPF